ncbi:MAG: DUF1732 domain-containing protein, partial [Gammaproteobacteria bacterium]
IEDELDYRFYAAGGEGATVEVQGLEGGDCRRLRLSGEAVLGLDFVPMQSRRCRNRCLFCFVDQMPDGLRKSLYVKDEDYRFSFLYGNYVTLASVKDEELDRLRMHVSEIRRILDTDKPVGRRLDFLMQELHREANTLGSKSADTVTTQVSVEMKVLIEQMREQIQNIE